MHNPSDHYRWSARLALCAIVGGVGLFLILSYLGVIDWPLLHPARRRALFNDPQHWQILSIGVAFLCAGLCFVIPSYWRLIGRACSLGVLGGLFAGIIGAFMAR